MHRIHHVIYINTNIIYTHHTPYISYSTPIYIYIYTKNVHYILFMYTLIYTILYTHLLYRDGFPAHILRPSQLT